MQAPLPERPTASRAQLVLAFCLSLACALPFLNKPVHQDDWAYLRVAQLLREAPADILAQTTIYQGGIISAGEGILHGPVWIHTLALCLGAGANGIWFAHWVSALCLAVLGLSIASLAGRFGLPPLTTALLVVLSPVPLVLAGNLMTDLPMLAAFSASLALGVRGIERASLRSLIAAGLVGAVGALTRYHGLAVLPMLLALPLAWPRARFGEALADAPLPRLRARHFAPFGIALVIVGGFLARTLILKGQADAARAANALDALDNIDRTLCALAAAAAMGGTLLGVSLGWLATPKRLGAAFKSRGFLVAVGVGLLIGVAVGWVARAQNTPPPMGVNVVLQWAILILFGIGMLLSARVLWQGAGRSLPSGLTGFARWRENHGHLLFLMFWLVGYLVAAWVTVPFGSTRYALPAMPAAILFVALFTQRELGVRALRVALVPMGLIGFGAAVADLHAAQVYPEFAEGVAQLEAQEPERDLWIWGELDFRWYLEEHPELQTATRGERPQILPRSSNEPRTGDRIFKSAICTAGSDGLSGTYQLNPKLVPRMRFEWERVFTDSWPVRIHNAYSSAGFYGAGGGILPFAWAGAGKPSELGKDGNVPHDKLQSYRIEDENPFLARIGEAVIETTDAHTLAKGNIHVESFLVYNGVELGIEMKPAIFVAFPGRVSFPNVSVGPQDSVLELFVAENDRSMYYPGPAGELRIRIDGQVVWEATLDARRNPDQRKWLPVEVDVTAYRGQSVTLAFEVAAGAWPDKPADATGPPKTFFGFAEPRLR